MEDRFFRNAMSKFATGVTVITTMIDGEPHGMTANAFMSVSLTPKLVLISIGEKARMLQKIKETGAFAVNILAEDQEELSRQFASQSKEGKKVEFELLDELPILKGALANITCKVYSEQIAGDHTLFLGEVISVEMRDGSPLSFFEGKYGTVIKHS